jgi:hypothetical protein
MVKWLLIIIGFLVLCIVGLFAVGWTTLNQTIDPKTEKGQVYGQTFKAGFQANCAREIAREVGLAAGGEELQDLCECAAEMTYEAYKDQSPAKLIAIADDPAEQKKIAEILQECADRAGIQ